MLTLNPESVCDVCADEYGPFNLPRCIPCGHVLCETCSLTIVEKTSPRLSPACPYCREPFTTESVRVIRVDYASPSNSASNSRAASRAASPAPRAWRSPRAMLSLDSSTSGPNGRNDDNNVMWGARGIVDDSDDRQCDDSITSPCASRDLASHRAEAKRLEDKINVVASKRCSVEDVQNLMKEIEEWLKADVQYNGKGTVCPGGEFMFTSLELSAALLHAILSNHKAHSDASKLARTVEASLRERCEKSEREINKLEQELKKHKLELSRLKGGYSSSSSTPSPSGTSTPTATPLRHQSISTGSASGSASMPTSPEASVFPSSSSASSAAAHTHLHGHAYASAPTSPLSRHHSHSRTTSLYNSSRPTTPSPAGTTTRSAASPGMLRSMTPGPGPISSASSAAEREKGVREVNGIPPVPPVPASVATLHPHRSMTPAVPVSAGGLGRYHGHAHGHGLGGHGRTTSVSMGVSHSGSSTHGRELINPLSFGSAGSQVQGQGHPNGNANVGTTAGGNSSNGPISSASANAGNTGTLPRPPVPPKPRLFSGSGPNPTSGSPPSSGHGHAQAQSQTQAHSNSKRESVRGIVDDRDGYVSSVERDRSAREKERDGKRKHERWLPKALGGKGLGIGSGISRPATSMN